MTQTVRNLASGQGWNVVDISCSAGPRDPAFDESHTGACIAVVTHGTFRYRTSQGDAVMTPGALLLGNAGACFECGHEHSRGDRCVSFQFAPDYWDRLIEGIGAGAKASFKTPKIPPLPRLAAVLADAEAARDAADNDAFEEIGLRLAGAAVTAHRQEATLPLSTRDHKRVAQAIYRIEGEATRPISLDHLAGEAATSPYHFLRVFKQIAGLTPYQFVLKTRLHRAAIQLRTTDDLVSTIAFDAGFNDLSTFNRRFRGIMGVAPGIYRLRHRQKGLRKPA